MFPLFRGPESWHSSPRKIICKRSVRRIGWKTSLMMKAMVSCGFSPKPVHWPTRSPHFWWFTRNSHWLNVYPQKKKTTMWRFPEMGIPLNHPCFHRIFHLGNPWKPSILWYPHLWKSSFAISIFDYQRLGRHAPTSLTLASCDVSSATAAFAWWGGWNDVVHQKYPQITIEKKHSMDWFKGKFTGKPLFFNGKIYMVSG